MRFRVRALVLLLSVAFAGVVFSAPPAAAQQGSAGAVTAADYQRAEKFLTYNTSPLVFHRVRATWLADDRFWYRDTGPTESSS